MTGATGTVGRHVVAGLLRDGARVRALTRTPATARLPPGTEIVPGDLAAPESCVDALSGVSAMFLFPLAYLTKPLRHPADTVDTRPILLAATLAGVRRVVMLGSSAALHDLEHAVESTAREWTILRPDEYAANRLADWAPMARAGNVIHAAHPTATSAPIHERDVAEVAVTALLTAGHHGCRHVLTGPQALTVRDQVAAVAAGIGRPLRLAEITPSRTRVALPAPLAHPTRTVEQVTGHPARTLTQWAADHAPAFTRPSPHHPQPHRRPPGTVGPHR
ncbi:NAD(P)H-binding protein [Actinophytocola xinjiangensis]|uniref:NAD(P)H-binding protein n=1 Tax=Actinophytocola xinjiangensis TaxID=485602 RepID=UPI001FEB6D9A|nr:NAD(P)H-binding protein [Actinophytocola xinjiangensis]